MRIEIPPDIVIEVEHLVLDYNGTLAQDGVLLPGVAPRIADLAGSLRIHVVTADTFGTVTRELQGLPCEIVTLPAQHQGQAKLDYARQLGIERSVCIGNGHNDRLMLADAALGIAVAQAEGAAASALAAARIHCPSILDALDLLRHPKRLTATLRD